MSLIALAWKQSSHYPLVLLANRDATYDRPSLPLHQWDGSPAIYAGQDQPSGGTWLGIAADGKFAAISDFHRHQEAESAEPEQSRGQLIVDYLRGQQDPVGFLQASVDARKSCKPFNLLLGDRQSLYYSCSLTHSYEELSPGIYGVSDYYMNTPMPKTHYVSSQLEKFLSDGVLTPEEQAALFQALTYPMRFAKGELPKRGFSDAYEQARSPVFLHLDGFGTVSSSLLLVDQNGHVDFEEHRFEHGKPGQTAKLEFQLR